MKRIVFFISLIFMSSLVLFAQEERKVKANAEMAFTTLSHDYGSIVYGADGTYNFQFKNNADKPIVITNVKSSCGCTIPSWPKDPIQPGKTGKITVKYNTKLPGSFNKTVQVFSTAANSPVKLTVRGKVNAKASDLNNGQSNTNLRNGTKIKEGVNQSATTNVQKTKEMSKEESTAMGGDGKLSRSKEAKKAAYKKKLEEQKKTKK